MAFEVTLKHVQQASSDMSSAHHGRARGGARAHGARARARAHRAALGAGRGHLQGCATLNDMHMMTWLWLAE